MDGDRYRCGIFVVIPLFLLLSLLAHEIENGLRYFCGDGCVCGIYEKIDR